ncbi:MAG: RNA polymerase sigma factor [Rhodothermales bacterium]
MLLMASALDASRNDRRDILLLHLDSLYMMAQALTPDPDQAVQLVEATYTQAYATLPLGFTDQENKRWLLQLMMQVHIEQTEFENPNLLEVDRAESAASLHMFRQRLAEQIVERVLPAVFATLPEDQRLILLLCEVEALPCADAGVVLGLEAEDARARLASARSAVESALHAETSQRERHLLESSLPDDWLTSTLSHAVESEFSPLPPTLRPAVLEASRIEPSSAETTTTPSSTPVLVPLNPEQDTTSAPSEQYTRPLMPRLLKTTLLIATVALIGYLASQVLEREPETNLITLSVEQADGIRPTLLTDSPAQAESFILEELNWHLTLPSIDRAVLIGVGIREMASGVRAPVFLYQDPLASGSEHTVTLYVFNYAFLDQHKERIHLAPDILRQIEEEQSFDLYDLGKRNVLVWRNRDDIFVAVTSGDAETLRERIVFPS